MRRVTAAMGVVASLIACARPVVPPPSPAFDRPIDQPCNPRYGALQGSSRELRVADAAVTVPAQWLASYGSMNEMTLTRSGSELNVWKGSDFTFPPMLPVNAVQCAIVRGDTTIVIRSEMLRNRTFRVDVKVSPLIGGQYFYMQLQTGVAERLKDMRGIIESLRFPSDTSVAARK